MIARVLSSKKNVQEFIKFCIVGAGNTGLNYLIYVILLMGLKINYLVAGVIGYLSGAALGFIINRKWTFKSKVPHRYIVLYLVINVFSMLVNMLIQWIVVEKFHVMVELSQICGIAVTTLINYFFTRNLVFKRKGNSSI